MDLTARRNRKQYYTYPTRARGPVFPVSITFTAPCHLASTFNLHSAVPMLKCQNGTSKAQREKEKAYLLTNPLPTILALDRVLDNRVTSRPPVNKCHSIQRDTNADEVEYFIDESASSKSQSVSPHPATQS